MVNIDMLKKRIAEKGFTVKSLANEIGLSYAVLCRKFQNNGKGVTVNNATDIVRVLGLSDAEAITIFLVFNVASSAANATHTVDKDKQTSYRSISLEENI